MNTIKSIDNIKSFNSLLESLACVGISAAEAGKALQELSKYLCDNNPSVFNLLGEIADQWNEIGCTSFLTEPEDCFEIDKGINLLRPETRGTLEISNQKSSFDFLEQNAYDKVNLEWITPFDSV